jgi:tetratricopeptide (TPR) repeat protein
MRIEQRMDRLENGVLRVEYSAWPEDWVSGQDALREGRFLDARDAFLKVSRADPKTFPQALQYGLFYAAESLRMWAAVGNPAAWKEALALYGDLFRRVPDTVHFAKAHLGRGKCLLELGKTPDALAAFNRVLESPNASATEKIGAKVQVARIAEEEGRLRTAVKAYRDLLRESQKLAPPAVPVVKVRLAACKLRMGKFDEAADEFSRILASDQRMTDPQKRAEVNSAAYAGRGECYWKKKEYEKGMWDFLRVIILYGSSNTQTPKALWHASACMKNMAAQHRKAGEKDRARIWRGRSVLLFRELGEKFPRSPWLHKE